MACHSCFHTRGVLSFWGVDVVGRTSHLTKHTSLVGGIHKHICLDMLEWYTVWMLQFNLAVPDPEMTSPRYHTTIFVETDKDDRSGTKYHVVADITSGMQYESRRETDPSLSEEFHARVFLGYTRGRRPSRAVGPPPPCYPSARKAIDLQHGNDAHRAGQGVGAIGFFRARRSTPSAHQMH